MKRILPVILLSSIILVTVSGCTGSKNTPTATTLPATAAATEESLALKVNTDGITMAEYQFQLGLLQKAQADAGTTSTPDEQRNRVIDSLTSELLLAQAAAQGGHVVDDAMVQAQIDKLASEMGGADKLQAYEATYGFTDESFKMIEKREMAALWEMNQIFSSVPTTADQVHVRRILVQEKANADSYYQQLQSGTDFAKLAYTLDPTTGGDMGWFPKGYIFQQAVEDAAFSLQPGQYSNVIQTDLGYYIIFVIERDANHPLSADALKAMQQKKLDEWLAASKAVSTIDVFVK